jgi:threonine dehydratase
MVAPARLSELEKAAADIHAVMPPTPQYAWPLLSQRCGCEVWVKHENHTPLGAFKLRGGIVHVADLVAHAAPAGIITATRGNHGQSIGFAARSAGIKAVVVVPHGNSTEKNAAMRALGVELVEHGADYQEAREYADARAAEEGLAFVGPYAPLLVRGVASYGLEFFRAVADLDAVYVPIGMGSGLCGTIAAREALGLKTEIIGVVAEQAPCYALSFAAGKPVSTNSADTLADGLACRVPDADALAVMLDHAGGVIAVSEDEIKAAMRHYFTDTHNIAEGAGAAPLAGLLKERARWAGKKVGLILSGGNIDKALYRDILSG